MKREESVTQSGIPDTVTGLEFGTYVPQWVLGFASQCFATAPGVCLTRLLSLNITSQAVKRMPKQLCFFTLPLALWGFCVVLQCPPSKVLFRQEWIKHLDSYTVVSCFCTGIGRLGQKKPSQAGDCKSFSPHFSPKVNKTFAENWLCFGNWKYIPRVLLKTLSCTSFPQSLLIPSIFSMKSIAPSTVLSNSSQRTESLWFRILGCMFQPKDWLSLFLSYKSRHCRSILCFICSLHGSKSPPIFGQSFIQLDVISRELPVSGISQHKILKGSETCFGKQAFREARKECNNENNCSPLELGMVRGLLWIHETSSPWK